MPDKMNREKQEQMTQLYQIYEQHMYRVALSILRDEGKAEDAVHNAFVKLILYR